MRIPAALTRWAAAHNHQLSPDTRAELDVIASIIGASSLRDRDIAAPMAGLGSELREIFPEERADRAEGLLRVVAEWARTQRSEQQAQPTIAEVRTLPAAVERQAPVRPPEPGTGRAPVVASGDLNDLDSTAPAFLRSDRVDEDDNQRLFGSARPYARILLGVLSLAALAALAVGVWWWGTRTQDPAATATTDPAATDAGSASGTPPVALTPTPTPTAVPASESPPREWADIETILNGGSGEIVASTYPVSASNRAVLTGHTAGITGIAISDSGRVLTSGADARLVDWGAEVTLARPDVLSVDAPLTVLTRTTDQRVVAGDSLGNLIVFDLVGGTEPQVVAVHNSALSAVTELRDGRFAVASVDGEVKVLALQAAGDALDLAHSTEVTALLPLVDGRIVSGAVDGAVRIWPATGGPAVAVIETMGAPVTALGLLNDELIVVGSIDGRIQILDPAEPDQILAELEVQPGRIRAIRQVSSIPDLTVVAVGGDDSMIRLVDLNTAVVRATLAGHGDLITAIDELPDGQLVSTSGDATARVWDLDLALRDTNNPAPPHESNVSHLAAWQGNRFVTGGTDGVVTLSSTVEGTPSEWLTSHGAPLVGLVVMPNGDVVSLDAASSLKLIQPDVGDGGAVELSVAPGARALDNRTDVGVVTGHADGTVRFSDFTTEVASVSAHDSGVNVVLGLTTGLVASGGDDGMVRIIDIDAGPDAALPVFDLHQAPITALTELPDGRIASAASDGIFVWSLEDMGEEHIRLTGHREPTITLLALDSRRLLSAATDGRVRLWDLDDPTGEPETILDIPGVVNPVVISTEAGLLVSGAGRGFVTAPTP